MASTHNRTRLDGIVVPPRSTESVAQNADAVRDVFGLADIPYFPVMKVYEYLDLLVPGAKFEVREMHEMGSDHGRTYPDSGLIQLREDVYERADRGEGRDRFTMCHELGHLMMHRGIALSRIDPHKPPKVYCNSEWQADKYASFLLMPRKLVAQCSSTAEMQQAFGVSSEAAWARRGELKN